MRDDQTNSGDRLAHDVVIVGGGAAGLAVAASLKRRAPGLDVAVIEPSPTHYYQPGWTMVGAGVFAQSQTARPMQSAFPPGVRWIEASAADIDPVRRVVGLGSGAQVAYRRLVLAPGLKLDWDAVPGLHDTLGRNGVTSNYRYDLAPYTWALIQAHRGGTALFTQPPMPIKCAGAPQKAMYLAADHWRRHGQLADTRIEFFAAAGALFGVADYVPALMRYVDRYGIDLRFQHRLTRIDGDAKTAWFERTHADGARETVERGFDMIHVVPPQTPRDWVAASPFADAAGWIDVDRATLRHANYEGVYGLGDACSAPNAKTVAAARKQAPVVAHNLLNDMDGARRPDAHYDGYGSCPLTVERGRIVLAEFGYGGALKPSFPRWLLDGREPTRAAWFLKEKLLPPLYWRAMLRGHEWLAAPKLAA